MSINPIVQSNQIQTSEADPNGIVGKDGFLNLLVTQLRYQDPLNPMDNQQMLSQLAQFSSLEQMSQLNNTISSQQDFTSFLNATRLIGKEVSMFDPTAPADQPRELITTVESVTFAEDQPVLTLGNGLMTTADAIFRVSDPQQDQQTNN